MREPGQLVNGSCELWSVCMQYARFWHGRASRLGRSGGKPGSGQMEDSVGNGVLTVSCRSVRGRDNGCTCWNKPWGGWASDRGTMSNSGQGTKKWILKAESQISAQESLSPAATHRLGQWLASPMNLQAREGGGCIVALSARSGVKIDPTHLIAQVVLHCPHCVTNASFTHQDFTNLSSICDIKKTRKQLAFHETSNTSERTTSCSSQQGHSNLHSSTGDEDGHDDNAKKSKTSTSSSVGGTRNPDTPTHRDPRSPAPDPTPISRSLSPGRGPRSPPPDG